MFLLLAKLSKTFFSILLYLLHVAAKTKLSKVKELNFIWLELTDIQTEIELEKFAILILEILLQPQEEQHQQQQQQSPTQSTDLNQNENTTEDKFATYKTEITSLENVTIMTPASVSTADQNHTQHYGS